MVGTWKDPAFGSQTGTTYKTNLDNAHAVAKRFADAFAAHEIFAPTFSFVPGDVNTGTEKITETAHGMVNDQQIKLTTTGTLPAPLVVGTTYFVVGVTANDFQLALTSGGAAINLTDGGTGVHTLTAQPSMHVTVDAGTLWNGVTLTEIVEQITITIVAPTTNPRKDRVVRSRATGVISVVAGAEGASPVPPAVGAGRSPICQISLITLQTSIVNTDLTDERVATQRADPILWTSAREIQTPLTIGPIVRPALTAFNGSDVVFVDSTNRDLRLYRHDGETFAEVGTELNIAALNAAAIAALNATDIALLDDGNLDLRLYRLSGGTWTLIGTELPITGVVLPSLTALNGTDIAMEDAGNEDLRVYRFDFGAETWSQIGSDLNNPGVAPPQLSAFNKTDIARFGDTLANPDELALYRFNGTVFAKVGTEILITSAGDAAITALNSTDIAFIDETQRDIRIYRWDEDAATFAQVGNQLSLPVGLNDPAMVAINGTDIVYIDGTQDQLRLYRFGFALEGPPAPPLA